MVILGYIVSKNKIKETFDFIDVVSDYSMVKDKDKPILIVGLEEARKIASSFSIIEKKLDNNLFWTFGKREKRLDFEKDVEAFQEYVIKKNINTIQYHYINLVKLKLHSIKRLIKIINNSDEKYFYFKNNMIYLYYKDIVASVSTDILSLFNVSKKKIFNIIRGNKKNIIFTNDNKISSKIKRLIVNKQYVIPYLLSLN